jgi:hypothetical protein
MIEAPRIVVSGASAGVVANGGAGGGCSVSGPDALDTAAPALGAVFATYFACNGGTGSGAPGTGCRIGIDTCVASCPVAYGGAVVQQDAFEP